MQITSRPGVSNIRAVIQCVHNQSTTDCETVELSALVRIIRLIESSVGGFGEGVE